MGELSKIPKKGVEQKEEGKQRFKKGGDKLDQWVSTLKGEAGTPYKL